MIIQFKIYENTSLPEVGDFVLLYNEITREDSEIAEIVGFDSYKSKYLILFPSPPLIEFSCDLSNIKHFGTKE